MKKILTNPLLYSIIFPLFGVFVLSRIVQPTDIVVLPLFLSLLISFIFTVVKLFKGETFSKTLLSLLYLVPLVICFYWLRLVLIRV